MFLQLIFFQIFRQFHPQDSILSSIGIWTGFDFSEEREQVRGTVDGDLRHEREELEEDTENAAAWEPSHVENPRLSRR
jgi:asparagine synthase (glutamine-hydrolysing)